MKAKDWFTDESKWVQGALTADNGARKCLLAALSDAYHGTVYGLMLGRLRHFVHLIRPDLPHSGSVSEFNDDPKTKFADIQRVLELADV